VAVAGVAVLLGIGAALFWRIPPPGRSRNGSYLSPRRALPDFSLIDQSGHTLGRKICAVAGRSCIWLHQLPGRLPDHPDHPGGHGKRLQASGSAVRPHVVFVSVDAKRDTPAQLAKYVPYFDPEFVA